MALAGLTLTLCLAGCESDDDGGSSAEEVEGETATGEPVELQFGLVVDGAEAACNQEYTGLGTSGASAQFADLRFFISQVELLRDDGTSVPLALTVDGKWQSEDVALLDFEDGTGDCSETGNADTNTTIRGRAPAGSYTGVRFALGVPFELNHQNAEIAQAPLNVAAMWWIWQGGYKFLRIDLTEINGEPATRWNIHIGSTGCESALPALPPESPCAKPNLPVVELTGVDPTQGRILADIGELLAAVDIAENTTDSPPGCMSNPVEPAECTPVFETLGISFDEGDCINDCADQNWFTVE